MESGEGFWDVKQRGAEFFRKMQTFLKKKGLTYRARWCRMIVGLFDAG